jgi:hypothetical protein
MDDGPPCKIESAQFVEPASRIPYPVSNRIVDQGCPEEDKDDQRTEADAFDECPNDPERVSL